MTETNPQAEAAPPIPLDLPELVRMVVSLEAMRARLLDAVESAPTSRDGAILVNGKGIRETAEFLGLVGRRLSPLIPNVPVRPPAVLGERDAT